MNRRYLHIAAAAVTLLGLSAWFVPAPRLLWNASHSAPVGLYRIDAGAAPMVGDWVAIEPPADLADYMARRNYLPPGVPLLKRVAALPGARVCRSGVFVTVDGRAVARALARDRAGRPLPVWLGCRIVRPREIFLINAAPDSLDGRYFGPLPTTGLLGPAHPILTRDASGAPLRWRPSGRDLAFPRSEME